jgi:hypothetical protein
MLLFYNGWPDLFVFLEQQSRDYGLTERRISQIVAEQRAAFVARKQRRLF